MKSRLVFTCVGLIFLLGLVGCGGTPQSGTISGTVTFQGTPITMGSVTFLCEKATPKVHNSSIELGKYSFKNVPLGPVKVIIQSSPPPDAAPKVLPPKGAESTMPKEVPIIKGPYVKIPAKYTREETSGLTYTVIGGDQKKDFELTP